MTFTFEIFELLADALIDWIFATDSLLEELLMEDKTDENILVMLVEDAPLYSTECVSLEVDVAARLEELVLIPSEETLFHKDEELNKIVDLDWLDILEKTGNEDATEELSFFVIGAAVCPSDIKLEREEVFIVVEKVVVESTLFEFSIDELCVLEIGSIDAFEPVL